MQGSMFNLHDLNFPKVKMKILNRKLLDKSIFMYYCFLSTGGSKHRLYLLNLHYIT